MQLYQGRAKILQGDRRIELDQCFIDQDSDSRGFLGWLGRYTLVNATDDPDILSDAILELEDGRKGDIILRKVVALSGYGEFRGLGPPPS